MNGEGIAGEHGEVWFNDQEADHVHRCGYSEPHDSYHWCGHTYRIAAADCELTCGIGW